MDNTLTRPFTPSSEDASESVPPSQAETLEAQLAIARSEAKKAKAAFETMLEFASSQVKPSEARSLESRAGLEFTKEIRNLKKKLENAINETKSVRAGFQGLFDMVVALKSDLSEGHERELDYMREIRRLNIQLQKAEADGERLKSRYREATYTKAGEIARRYSQDTASLAISDGRIGYADESMLVGVDDDVGLTQSHSDIHKVDVKTSSLHAIHGGEDNCTSRLVTLDTVDNNTVISGCLKGLSLNANKNGCDSKFHILDSPIEDSFNQKFDLIAIVATVNGDQEHGDESGSVAADVSPVLTEILTPPNQMIDDEFTYELRDIDFLDLEDILRKETITSPSFPQANASANYTERLRAQDFLANGVDLDAVEHTTPFQGDEYLDPDLDLNTVRYISHIKIEAVIGAELPPTVLQVGSDIPRRVFSGGRYVKGQLVKDAKYFTPPVLTDSKSSTNLGPFDSFREREAAIRSNKRYAGRQDRAFPDIFRHGIFYEPSPADKNVYRTLHIGNLPVGITLCHLLTRIRGGAIASAVICDTIAITGSKSALIVFQDEHAASAYTEFAAKYPIVFENQRAEITLLKSPTWPIAIPAQKRMEAMKQTRCLDITSFIKHYSEPQDLFEKETRNQQLINNITSQLSGCGKQKFNVVHDVYLDDDNTLHLSFSSIQAAGTAYGILQREKNKEFGKNVTFVADPCARPLKDLLEIKKTTVHHNSDGVGESISGRGSGLNLDDGKGDGLSQLKANHVFEEKLYDNGHPQKIDSKVAYGQYFPEGDGLEQFATTKREPGNVIVPSGEDVVVDKAISSGMDYHKAGVTSIDPTTKGSMKPELLGEFSTISGTLPSDSTTSETGHSFLKGLPHTPKNSTSSISSALLLVTPTSSHTTYSPDSVNSQNGVQITSIDEIDLCITNKKPIPFTTTPRTKQRTERQSWADIMIEEAEMEQISQSVSSKTEPKSPSGPSGPSTSTSSGDTSAANKTSSEAPSSTSTTKMDCPICAAGHKATGSNNTDAPVVTKMFCVPAPDSDTGFMARLTNAGIGGMQACNCDGHDCCASGCLCRRRSANKSS